MAILNPSNVVLEGKTREKGVFASNGKEYPFLLVGAFPKPPPDKYVRAEHHAGHGGLRVRKDASLPEA
jgi:hypothetical protein